MFAGHPFVAAIVTRNNAVEEEKEARLAGSEVGYCARPPWAHGSLEFEKSAERSTSHNVSYR